MSLDAIDWMFTTMEKVFGTARGDDGRVMDGMAWERFLSRLADAGRLVLREGMPSSPIDRADGFRNLLIVLQFALERTLGAGDPYHPTFSPPWPAHVFDWGAASPDSVYHSAALRHDTSYRISGTLGNAASMSFQFFKGQKDAGTVLASQLQREPTGAFELVAGGAQRPGNWIPLAPGTNGILTREFFADWSSAVPSTLRIECLEDRTEPWPITSADRVERELDAIGEWLYRTTKFWSDKELEGHRRHPNSFEPEFLRGGTALPALCFGHWQLAPGECLVIEMPDPQAPYWSIQLATFWFRTLDFANRMTSLNNGQAVIDPDGTFRAVLAHEDPGIANWFDTLGHRSGALLLRIADGKDLVVPRTRLLPVEALDRELPSAPRVDAATRRRQVAERRAQITRLLLR